MGNNNLVDDSFGLNKCIIELEALGDISDNMMFIAINLFKQEHARVAFMSLAPYRRMNWLRKCEMSNMNSVDDCFGLNKCIIELKAVPGISDDMMFMAINLFKQEHARVAFMSLEPYRRSDWLRLELLSMCEMVKSGSK
ncbi:hypothetical protein ACHQM5_005566 [Ranunculus cassubicifolius]